MAASAVLGIGTSAEDPFAFQLVHLARDLAREGCRRQGWSRMAAVRASPLSLSLLDDRCYLLAVDGKSPHLEV